MDIPGTSHHVDLMTLLQGSSSFSEMLSICGLAHMYHLQPCLSSEPQVTEPLAPTQPASHGDSVHSDSQALGQVHLASGPAHLLPARGFWENEDPHQVPSNGPQGQGCS
jgi:hypothetical protein